MRRRHAARIGSARHADVALATLGAIAVAGGLATPARADVIYMTDDPFGSPFGLIGFDVCLDQSVALRFTPDADYTLDRVSLWFMSNDFNGTIHPLVEVSLRNDGPGGTIPGPTTLEDWTFNVAAVGWNPVLEVMDSVTHPPLDAGANYWIVTESQAVCGLDGVWNWAGSGTGFVATSTGYGQPWQPGGMGAVVATIIEATPALAGDLNADGVIDTADLLILLTAWGACPPPPRTCPADLDGNGSTDTADLLILLASWT